MAVFSQGVEAASMEACLKKKRSPSRQVNACEGRGGVPFARKGSLAFARHATEREN